MDQESILYSDDLVKFCAEFDKIPENDYTESLIEVTLQDLNHRWNILQASYKAVCTDKKQKVEKDFFECVQGKFCTCTREFHKCKAKIMDIQKTFIASVPLLNQPTQSSDDNFAHFKVPPCNTHIFYEGYEEWPSFRDMFTAVYIDKPRIPPVQKLYHLRLKVQGQAGAIIRKYKLCSEHFYLAWEALRDRYENQRILVENQIKILLNLPSISVENSESLQTIQSTINDCLSSIKGQDVPIGEWDPFIIMLCASKLPLETLSL